MEEQIIIKPSFDFKSTFKASIYTLLSNKLMLFFAVYMVIIAINVISTFAMEDIVEPISFLPHLLILPGILLLFTYSIYRSTKKQILENPRLKENIVYIFNNEFFQEKGDTYEIKHFWNNIHKIVEKKDFFLIYIAKNKANFIRKIDLKENQYHELKTLLHSLNIKKSLQ